MYYIELLLCIKKTARKTSFSVFFEARLCIPIFIGRENGLRNNFDTYYYCYYMCYRPLFGIRYIKANM